MKAITLTNGMIAMVDDEDFDHLNQYEWYLQKDGYAAKCLRISKGNYKTLLMHRVVMNSPFGLHTDHKDRNKLNNQKHNLRICGSSQNQMNAAKRGNVTSAFKGVYLWTQKRGYQYYRASLCINGKRFVKSFPNSREGELMAARAYNELALKHFGEFANLNQIPV